MSYPIDQAITYTAVASTQGRPSDTFTYAWSFDDNTTGNTNTLSKTWTTGGYHAATVTATDNTTQSTAVASKMVRVASSWITDTNNIPAYTSNFYGPSVVPLLDGTILIIGCRKDNNTTIGNTSYVYNPASRVLTQVGNLPASRIYTSGESAVRLSDGRVLATGAYISGSSGSIEARRTFIYDPPSRTWSESGLRNYGLEYGSLYTTVLMGNGKVFSASAYSTTFRNEIFDPSTGTWTLLPNQPSSTSGNGPSVCLMQDGRVFKGPGVNDADVGCVAYSPTTNTWSTLASCPSSQARIVAMSDGRLLGLNLSTPTPGQYIYTPSTDTWATGIGPTIPTPSGYPSLFTHSGETIYTRGSSSISAFNGTSWYAYPTLNTAHSGAYITESSGITVCIGSSDGSTVMEYLW